MSCCGKKRKQAKGSKPTLASPVSLLTRRDPEPPPAGLRPGDDAGDAAVTPAR